MATFASILAAGVALVAAVLGYLNHQKVIEVHALVNSRLTDALNKIGNLERYIGELTQKDKDDLPD